MLFYIGLAAARNFVVTGATEEALHLVEDICKLHKAEMKAESGIQLSENEYNVTFSGIEMNAKGKDELRKIFDLADKMPDVPSKIENIIQELKGALPHSIEDMVRSGTMNFAVCFIENGAQFKKLMGAETIANVKLFFSTDKDLAARLGVEFPGVLAFNAEDSNILKLKIEKGFKSLVSAITIPSFSRVSASNFPAFQSLDQNIFYVINTIEHFEALKEKYGAEMKGFSSEAKFVHFAPFEIPTLLEICRIKKSDYPVLMMLGNDKKLIVRNMDSVGLSTAVKNILSGGAELVSFASAIPEDNAVRPYKVINTETLASVVNDTSVDRFISVTSPNCHHCITTKPILQKLAQLLQEKKVEIFMGDYNIVENEAFAFGKVEGVPSFFYAKKGTSKLISVSPEARTLKGFADLISKQGGSAVIGADFLPVEEKNEAVSDADGDDSAEEVQEPEVVPVPEGKSERAEVL